VSSDGMRRAGACRCCLLRSPRQYRLRPLGGRAGSILTPSSRRTCRALFLSPSLRVRFAHAGRPASPSLRPPPLPFAPAV
jgi:hypothetical protein